MAFIAVIWIAEREPPLLGETGELIEAAHDAAIGSPPTKVGRELVLVVLGIAAMAIGASALVEGLRRITNLESTQAKLGLVVVGFATHSSSWCSLGPPHGKGVTAAVVAQVSSGHSHTTPP